MHFSLLRLYTVNLGYIEMLEKSFDEIHPIFFNFLKFTVS